MSSGLFFRKRARYFGTGAVEGPAKVDRAVPARNPPRSRSCATNPRVVGREAEGRLRDGLRACQAQAPVGGDVSVREVCRHKQSLRKDLDITNN